MTFAQRRNRLTTHF